MQYICGERKADGATCTEGGPSIQREVGRPDQETVIGKDLSAFHFAMGQPNFDYCEEEWGRYSIVYRLSVGE